MLDFLCYSLVWILAIYGFIEILKIIFYTFIKTPSLRNGEIHIIIGVRNSENTIESFIRTFFYKILNYSYNECNDIMIVDMNSTDNTKNILQKLNKDYNFQFKEIKNK